VRPAGRYAQFAKRRTPSGMSWQGDKIDILVCQKF
jgi:hypothetical protein